MYQHDLVADVTVKIVTDNKEEVPLRENVLVYNFLLKHLKINPFKKKSCIKKKN